MPLNINFQQVFLHMLNFVLLFGAMYFLLYKPVKNFMDAREETYRERDRASEELREKAEASKTEYEQKLANVNAEIEEVRAQAQQALSAELDEQRVAAQKTADEIVEKSRRDAQKEHDDMMTKAQSEIADIVASAAEKLVFADVGAAYDSFLNEAEGSGSDA